MNELDLVFNCLICSNTMCEPTTMHCGHSFCRSCTIKWCFQYRHYNCPVCRKKLDKSLPSINLSLKAAIDLMTKQDENVRKRFTKATSNDKVGSMKKTSSYPILDHDKLLEKITTSLNRDHVVVESRCLNETQANVNNNQTKKLNELSPNQRNNKQHFLIKTDSTLSRLEFFKFPMYLFFTLFGMIILILFSLFKKK